MNRFACIVCLLFAGAALGVSAMNFHVARESNRHVEARFGKFELDLLQTASRRSGSSIPEERVIDLPEDGNTWHTILILRDGWEGMAVERRAEAMFATEPLLASLKHQTHWHLITCGQKECRPFAALVDATPCLIIERANGQVVYRESGPELGKRPHALTHAIRKEIQRHCPDGKCMPLHPVPDDKEPVDEVPAVLKEEEKSAPVKSPSALPVAIVIGGGALAGFALKFRKAAAV